jgi:hypothetical protein
MGKRALRIVVLLAMVAVLGVSLYQRRTGAITYDKQCMHECDQRYTYCNNHPDGYWEGIWVGGDCSANETPTFCTTWECPNSMQLYSYCLENPTLSGCEDNIDPNYYYCDMTEAQNCYDACLDQASQESQQTGTRRCCVDSQVYSTGGTNCGCHKQVGACP